MNLHLAVLLAYAAILMRVGLWIGRRVRSSTEFFVAVRRLGPSLLFSTMLAANIGAGSPMVAAGLGYTDCPRRMVVGGNQGGAGRSCWRSGSIRRIRRIAADEGLHTLGDYLEHRFGGHVARDGHDPAVVGYPGQDDSRCTTGCGMAAAFNRRGSRPSARRTPNHLPAGSTRKPL